MSVVRQRGFYFDQEACTGCNACQMACKDLHDHPVGVNWRRVTTLEYGRYPRPEVVHLSISCNHCARPPCVDACPNAGFVKRPSDGAVVHNANDCVVCLECIAACPYGAIQMNPATGTVGKCDLCERLTMRGQEPACVAACPMDALELVWLDPPEADPTAVVPLRGLPDPALAEPSLRIRPHRHGAI
jgi:anaerobic dimethyl sulfoxide reductase subunit B (iron-sulfur subunit)